MSTRCTIASKLDDGSYRSIYCHFDGYPEDGGVGETLARNFNTDEAANLITSLGDVSSLAGTVRIEPKGRHSYDAREDGTAVFYHRDRGEDWADVRGETFPDLAELQKHAEHFLYVREGGRWLAFAGTEQIELPTFSARESLEGLRNK